LERRDKIGRRGSAATTSEAVMKIVLALLVVIVGSFSLGVRAEETDADTEAIKAAVAGYVEGWFASDPVRMKEALHPNLHKVTVKRISGSSTDYLDVMSAESLMAFAKHNQEWVKGKQTHSMKIVYQDEKIAVVHALSDDFYDVCGLAKVNGEWKIVHVLWAMNETEK
jgi:hypothetical protein